MRCQQIFLTVILLVCGVPFFVNGGELEESSFILSASDQQAKIWIHHEEPKFVRLAVMDLMADVKKITGRDLDLVLNLDECTGNCLLIGTAENLKTSDNINEFSITSLDGILGQWERYHIETYFGTNNMLVIAGSDFRGTMFGVYHFMEQYLEVDPLYFWSDREPEPRDQLAFKRIKHTSATPTFKYRGWFINDEDLLTEWYPSGGKRNIDYPFYQEVVNPELMEKVLEALVRSQMNLVIPASFIDIMNPAEEALVKVAATRGVFISQHHVEPVGVSAFAFFNYWKAKGEDRLFSYYSSREELIEVWETYAEKWATYPNVIWQIGLRGIGDRPMWMADPGIPQTEADYGRIISEAMIEQIKIIEKYDKRSEIPYTTTLWAEGAGLFADGHLDIPQECMIIFSDNSPGWIFTPDFYQVAREENRKYGIYYHQQVWGTGPHLAPAVHPSRTYRLFGEAIGKSSNEYAIINVSNIREFIFGIDATSEILVDYKNFDLNNHLDQWFATRYPSNPRLAKEAYQAYYDIFVEHDEKAVPLLLDGQTRGAGNDHLRKIQQYIYDPEKYRVENQARIEAKLSLEAEWARKHLSAQALPQLQADEYHMKVIAQRIALAKATQFTEMLGPQLNKKEDEFFQTDLKSNVLLMSGLTKWLDHILRARQAIDNEDKALALTHMELARGWFGEVEMARLLKNQGKWENWYLGDKKMNLHNSLKITEETLDLLKSSVR